MVAVVVTLPDILLCVLRAGMGPLGKGSSSPEFWRNIQRYWILRRMCRSINCSASGGERQEAGREPGNTGVSRSLRPEYVATVVGCAALQAEELEKSIDRGMR